MCVNARTVAVSGKQTGGEKDMSRTLSEIYEKAMTEYNAPDYSSMFPNWKRFVYINIQNNWLKMHGYPKHRKAEQKHRGRSARSVIIDELESSELTR